VRHAALEDWIGDGRRRVAEGDDSGALTVLYGATMMEGKGGGFSRTRELANGVLGLQGEDLDVVTRKRRRARVGGSWAMLLAGITVLLSFVSVIQY